MEYGDRADDDGNDKDANGRAIPDRKWLNAEQAAEYLALPSSRAVYQAVRRGEIPAYRLGSRLRFRREELDALVERGRVLTVGGEEITSTEVTPTCRERR